MSADSDLKQGDPSGSESTKPADSKGTDPVAFNPAERNRLVQVLMAGSHRRKSGGGLPDAESAEPTDLKAANSNSFNLAERSRLVRVLLLGSALRLALLVLFPDLVSHYLSGRVELSTPVTSYKRLVEGVHLSLHSVSPYDGGLFHQSPLLLVLFSVLHFLPTLFTNLLYVAVDALVAYTLAKLAAAKTMGSARLSTAAPSLAIPGEIHFACTPSAVATMYLFNPLTIATTLARSTIVFSHLAVVSALHAGISGWSNQAVLLTAIATHLSLYPAVLIAPVALMASRTQQQQPEVVSVGRVALVLGKFAVAVGALHVLFALVFGTQYFMATVDFTLRVADLQPNVGLFWYFFIEIFDEFRPFFFVVFQLTALAFAVPVSWRFRDDPLFAGTLLVGIVSALKSYPSWGDFSLFLGLLPLFEELAKYLQYSFLSANLLLYGVGLAPVFWHLWIEQGTGNANFFYAATLVYVFGQITLLFDLGGAKLRRELDVHHPETRTRTVIQE
ncbi:hypothetical protein GGI04_000660 [Coemansia thaxteri]|uniref:GPI transamidase subunit PIG-U n=1 Tax=Coemansia thaxteri TaxID=2663907 RepID=A0A9W8BJF1_9FUNG|nr:hypothetical protein H4R26_002770 [Coemansia thaxteri]KAJ2009187.1 hypothetical protein GGI04_000660 [Coemansia thaxteri]KAJ2471482.1 hypothetical protein GGI02_002244 [Coemansia sp. RSA 2322]KAJ2484627.1 hypothetical protein EV174_002292 [Coemansia sp. RSA 2320]